MQAAERTYLYVPFEEKDSAKSQGAKWDQTEKRWYVPIGVELNQFQKWMHPKIREAIEENKLQAIPPFYIAEANFRNTRVFAFAATGLIVENVTTSKRVVKSETIFTQLMCVPTQWELQLRSFCPSFFLDYSQTLEAFYWMNHDKAGTKIGSFFLHDEVDAPFGTYKEDEAEKIVLWEMKEEKISIVKGEYGSAITCFPSEVIHSTQLIFECAQRKKMPQITNPFS